MKVQKLTWAGIAVTEKDTTLLIDPIDSIENVPDKPLVVRLGVPTEAFVPLVSLSQPKAILITHTHPDHFDPTSLLLAYGPLIPIFLPLESSRSAIKAGFKNVTGVNVNESFSLEHLKVTATHSVDGFGSPQVAWVVESDNHKLIHAGDTLWHGYWWQIVHRFGGFDLACLPINGAVLEVPGLSEQSTLPACMAPEEAVEAAKLLGAKNLLPIHYQTFHHPPFYIETANPLERTIKRANEVSLAVKALQPGDYLELIKETNL